MKDLSRAIGKNDAYIQQFLDRQSPRRLPERERKLIAIHLGIDESALIDDDYLNSIGRPSGAQIRKAQPMALENKDLPIYGRALAGNPNAISLEGRMVGKTERPSFLENVEDAFAIYVNGDSMEPRFKHGEIVYINPHKPAMPGDDVLIEFLDDTGLVKELVRQTADKLIVKQHNPARRLTYKTDDIKHVRFIQGSRRR